MEGESGFRAWDELVPDVLGLIFKNLELLEILQVIPLVCKSWCKVVKGPYCWKRIDMHDCLIYGKVKLNRLLRTLITRSSGYLHELCVSSIDDQMFSFIAHHAGSLQTLKLSECSISDSSFEQFGSMFTSLTTLEITECNRIISRTLEAIRRNCKRLVSLSCNYQPYMEFDKPSSHEDEDESVTVSRTMPNLKHLSLIFLGISDSVVLDLLSGCPDLESLEIRGCWNVTLGPKVLKEKYPNLQVAGLVAEDSFYSDDSKRDCSDDESQDYDFYCCYCGSDDNV